MYADNSTLCCYINQVIGEEIINAELIKLWEWLGAIKLSLNIVKTKYMVFHTSQRDVIYPNLKVNNNNSDRHKCHTKISMTQGLTANFA